jgi:hypothetical protein
MDKNMDKINDLLKEFYDKISSEDKSFYEQLASKAISLEYKPKRDKVGNLSISFSNRKTKKTILKFDYGNKNDGYSFRLKFYANKNYSKEFDLSIKEVIERFSFKYVGCYGCGKCKKEKLGYNIEYEDGRKYFRCGGELIPIKTISNEIVDEVIKMMEIQHKAFMEELE